MLCATSYNIRWLLRIIVKKDITFLAVIFLCLQQAHSRGRSWLESVIAQTLGAANSWMSARKPHAYAHDIRRWLAVDVLADA